MAIKNLNTKCLIQATCLTICKKNKTLICSLLSPSCHQKENLEVSTLTSMWPPLSGSKIGTRQYRSVQAGGSSCICCFGKTENDQWYRYPSMSEVIKIILKEDFLVVVDAESIFYRWTINCCCSMCPQKSYIRSRKRPMTSMPKKNNNGLKLGHILNH